MIYGTALAVSNHVSSIYPFTVGGKPFPLYAAFAAVIVNLIVSAVLTVVFKALGLATGKDAITAADFQEGAGRRAWRRQRGVRQDSTIAVLAGRVLDPAQRRRSR